MQAQYPERGEEAVVLVEDLTQALDKRGEGVTGRCPRHTGQSLDWNVGGTGLHLGALTQTLTHCVKQVCFDCQ